MSRRPYTVPVQIEEYKEICPYDKAHNILPDRMQEHLLRCRRNHPDAPKKACPYNATHIYNVCEEAYHLSTCLDVKTRLHEVIETAVDTTIKPPPISNLVIDSEENWDNCEVTTYDPTEHLENNKILRLRQNIAPSERKQFRLRERERLAALRDTDVKSVYKPEPGKLEECRRPISVADTKRIPASLNQITSTSESDTDIENLARKANEWTIVGDSSKSKKGQKKTNK